ncbi:hypothetical protein [Streptomyces sp. NPDC053427]|uniref:hypothetical protein n=1 Tax=Streptomyces sp. NPDC053427 TaxID=3365701 RepID=UPI0037D4FDEE
MADWIAEGAAEWAGAKYAYEGVNTVSPGTEWPEYFHPYTLNPRDRAQTVWARSYDAVGYYAQLDTTLDGYNEPWATIDGMMHQETNTEAFELAGNADRDKGRKFLTEWTRGFVGDAALGREWRTTGPGLGDQLPKKPKRLG